MLGTSAPLRAGWVACQTSTDLYWQTCGWPALPHTVTYAALVRIPTQTSKDVAWSPSFIFIGLAIRPGLSLLLSESRIARRCVCGGLFFAWNYLLYRSTPFDSVFMSLSVFFCQCRGCYCECFPGTLYCQADVCTARTAKSLSLSHKMFSAAHCSRSSSF